MTRLTFLRLCFLSLLFKSVFSVRLYFFLIMPAAAAATHQNCAQRSCMRSLPAAPRRIAESKAPPMADRRRAIRLVPARAAGGSENDAQQQPPGGISEDVLARLRAAESEAAKLREQLAKVQVRFDSSTSFSFFFDLHLSLSLHLPTLSSAFVTPKTSPLLFLLLFRLRPNPPQHHLLLLSRQETASTGTASPASPPSLRAPPRARGSPSRRSSSSPAAASARRPTAAAPTTRRPRRRPRRS